MTNQPDQAPITLNDDDLDAVNGGLITAQPNKLPTDRSELVGRPRHQGMGLTSMGEGETCGI